MGRKGGLLLVLIVVGAVPFGLKELESEVKLELGLEGKDGVGVRCFSERRFERRGVAEAESICGYYNIRAFLLEASRSMCNATYRQQSRRGSQTAVLTSE